MAKRGRRTASTAWRTHQPAAPVQVTRLHPLITAHLGEPDLRRVTVLRTADGYAVDVIVRNPVVTVPTIAPRPTRRTARKAA